MISLPPGNFAAPFFAEAETTPQRLAIATMERHATYGVLRDMSLSFALHMRMAGVTNESRIALAGSPPIIMTAVTLACALLGCSWLRATHEALAMPALGVTHLLQVGDAVSWPGTAPLTITEHWMTAPAPPPGGHAPCTGFRSPDDAWMIAHSSGTTGSPKFMALTNSIVHDRITQGAYAANRANRVAMTMFPTLSFASALPCLRSLAAGGSFLFGNPVALKDRTRIDSITGSPAHFAGYMDATLPGPPRIPEAIVTGADAGPAFFGRMLNHFDSIAFSYGATETSIIATRAVTGDNAADDISCVGPVAAHCDVKITAPDGTPVPDGEEGEISVRSQGMVTAYINEPDLTAEVFRGGRFHPGDLGRLDAQGRLHITGRVKDLLNVGGTKLNPSIVEAALQSVPGIRDIACFAADTGDGIRSLAIAVVADQTAEPSALAAQLQEAARDRLTPATAPRRLYVVDRIPRNENGKVLRQQIAAAVRGHPPVELPALAGPAAS